MLYLAEDQLNMPLPPPNKHTHTLEELRDNITQ